MRRISRRGRRRDMAASPSSRDCALTSWASVCCVMLAIAPGTSCFSFSPGGRAQPRAPTSIISHPSIPRYGAGGASIIADGAGTSSSRLRSSSTSDDTIASNSAQLDDAERLHALAALVNGALDDHGSEVLKTLSARVGVISDGGGGGGDFQARYLRLGLVATDKLKEGQTVASMPFYDTDGSGLALSPWIASKVVFGDALPDGYDGWTGDVGLLAMLLLNEMARLNVDAEGGPRGVDLPRRKGGMQSLMAAWVASLPAPGEMSALHPLMWDELDQEKLQSSSTKKVNRLLDDCDDDSSWLDEKVWSADRQKFPEVVKISVGDAVEERPCFTPDGFRYAVSLVRSRSYFVDGALRLLPYLDYANHDDFDSYEISDGTVGMLLGSTKGAVLKAGRALRAGDEVRVSYGPKGPADYLLDHGFVPPMCRLASSGGVGGAITAELSFEVDESDRFRDDKLDVLEYETYDLAPMEPTQTFDVTGGPGSTGEPDPAMIQFLRLVSLGGKDAFLLEAIFRREVWEFMGEPVSEVNERATLNLLIDAIQNALSEMEEGGAEIGDSKKETDRLIQMVRESEAEALSRTLSSAKQDSEALDLKEYYQERRLKRLGLDSEWTPEDDMSFGGTRVPGGADYDW